MAKTRMHVPRVHDFIGAAFIGAAAAVTVFVGRPALRRMAMRGKGGAGRVCGVERGGALLRLKLKRLQR